MRIRRNFHHPGLATRFFVLRNRRSRINYHLGGSINNNNNNNNNNNINNNNNNNVNDHVNFGNIDVNVDTVNRLSGIRNNPDNIGGDGNNNRRGDSNSNHMPYLTRGARICNTIDNGLALWNVLSNDRLESDSQSNLNLNNNLISNNLISNNHSNMCNFGSNSNSNLNSNDNHQLSRNVIYSSRLCRRRRLASYRNRNGNEPGNMGMNNMDAGVSIYFHGISSVTNNNNGDNYGINNNNVNGNGSNNVNHNVTTKDEIVTLLSYCALNT